MGRLQPNRAHMGDGIFVHLRGTDWTVTEIIDTLGPHADGLLIELHSDTRGEAVALRGNPADLAAAVERLPLQPDDLVRMRRKYDKRRQVGR